MTDSAATRCKAAGACLEAPGGRRWSAARTDFPALRREVSGTPARFLDGPAGTQVPAEVVDAIAAYYRTSNANTHGAFVTSHETDVVISRARAAMSDLLGTSGPESISFGANMTSLCFALSRALESGLETGDEVVITALDHEANRAPWLRLRDRGVIVREIGLGADGRLDPSGLEDAIGERTRIVAIGFASNALGTVNDVVAARLLSAEIGALLVVDAVHAAPHFAIDMRALDADFLLCSAYKFYGPHVGVLASKPGRLEQTRPEKLRPQDERAPYRIETGTLNHAALAGVTAAVDYLASWGAGEDRRSRLRSTMEALEERERGLARRYYDGLQALPAVKVWGPDFDDGRRAPTVSITVDGMPADEVAAALAERGIFVWDGDFYASRAIDVLGLRERGGLVRVGVSLYTTEEDIDRLVAALTEIV